jgi:hypothetical protein
MVKPYHRDPDDPDQQEPPKHRFRFGERWERRRQARAIRKAWLILALDLALLLIIVALTRMLLARLR